MSSESLKNIQEKCGVFAVYPDKPRVLLNELLTGGYGIQNRGQNGFGLAVGGIDHEYKIHTQDGLVKEIEALAVLKFQEGENKWGMLQCRYGTNGDYGSDNNQPCMVTSPDGTRITVAHNGEFAGIEKHKNDSKMSDTRIFTDILAQETEGSWDDRVKNVLGKMEGAYSLVIGIDDTLYVARDKYGIRPLLVAENGYDWLVASETPENIDTSLIREIKPGEISKIENNRLSIIQEGDYSKKSECIFEFPYIRSPGSMYCDSNGIWRSIYGFRQESGTYLAKQFKEELERKKMDIDFIIGIPESGLPIAEGFGNELGKPVNNVIRKRPSQYQADLPTRTFMADKDMNNISKSILKKLSFIPDKSIYKNKRIVCVDDSVVRSSTAKVIVEKLKSLGAKSVDWVSGLPMVIDKCHLGISIRTREELVAFLHHSNQNKIAKAIGVRNMTFINPESIIRAINGGDFIEAKKGENVFIINGFCGGCLSGTYPVSKEGESHWK